VSYSVNLQDYRINLYEVACRINFSDGGSPSFTTLDYCKVESLGGDVLLFHVSGNETEQAQFISDVFYVNLLHPTLLDSNGILLECQLSGTVVWYGNYYLNNNLNIYLSYKVQTIMYNGKERKISESNDGAISVRYSPNTTALTTLRYIDNKTEDISDIDAPSATLTVYTGETPSFAQREGEKRQQLTRSVPAP